MSDGDESDAGWIAIRRFSCKTTPLGADPTFPLRTLLVSSTLKVVVILSYPVQRVFSMGNESQRRGITVVELIVVVLVIGFLIALLLPATECARESARRAACLNNMKQLGLGLQNMESAYGRFPSSCTVKRDADGNNISLDGWSWCIMILPYIGGSEYCPSEEFWDAGPLGETVEHTQAMCAIISELHCPSFAGTEFIDIATEA
ncbi:MAG TPA: DUF1559 domain-containing protein, partial [Thermoguttaceae bacterium]|nr:DUF1559 domain-containing protein [Thermoguttaceae bacterium]